MCMYVKSPHLKCMLRALTGIAQLVWLLAHKAKGRWFNSQSGLVPGLWAWSSVGACERGS